MLIGVLIAEKGFKIETTGKASLQLLLKQRVTAHGLQQARKHWGETRQMSSSEIEKKITY